MREGERDSNRVSGEGEVRQCGMRGVEQEGGRGRRIERHPHRHARGDVLAAGGRRGKKYDDAGEWVGPACWAGRPAWPGVRAGEGGDGGGIGRRKERARLVGLKEEKGGLRPAKGLEVLTFVCFDVWICFGF